MIGGVSPKRRLGSEEGKKHIYPTNRLETKKRIPNHYLGDLHNFLNALEPFSYKDRILK